MYSFRTSNDIVTIKFTCSVLLKLCLAVCLGNVLFHILTSVTHPTAGSVNTIDALGSAGPEAETTTGGEQGAFIGVCSDVPYTSPCTCTRLYITLF